jgi:hypothetical protein
MNGQREVIRKNLRNFEEFDGLIPDGSTILEDLLVASRFSKMVSPLPLRPTQAYFIPVRRS